MLLNQVHNFPLRHCLRWWFLKSTISVLSVKNPHNMSNNIDLFLIVKIQSTLGKYLSAINGQQRQQTIGLDWSKSNNKYFIKRQTSFKPRTCQTKNSKFYCFFCFNSFQLSRGEICAANFIPPVQKGCFWGKKKLLTKIS